MSSAGAEGYDCDFVSPPPKVLQTECAVCLLILREPHLTSCCGHSFCRACIERIQKDGKPCPLCKKENFTTLHNGGLERALKELAVQCGHKRSGCSWSGELGALDNHLSMACLFVEVKCRHTNCHHVTKRRDVASHEASCGFRPFSCNWCQKYVTWYDDIKDKHWPMCPNYPVSCHQCKASVERQHLPRHKKEDCLFTLVDCFKTQLSTTAEKLRHLTMENQKLFNENAILSKRISDLEVRAVEQKTEMEKMAAERKETESKMAQNLAKLFDKVSTQKRQLDNLVQENKAMECCIKEQINTIPINLEIPEFQVTSMKEEVQLNSCDFYSCYGGFKMRFQLYAKLENNYDPPSIWMRMAFLAGAFDDLLEWPFNSTIVIHKQTFSGKISFYIDFRTVPLEFRSRPKKEEDCGEYLSQRLGYCSSVTVELLQSNCPVLKN